MRRAVLLPDKLPFNWRWVRWQYFLKLINSGIENTQIFDHTIFVLENISILWSCLMNEWKNLKKEISWFLLNIHCLIEFLNFDIDTFRKLLLQFYFTVLYLKMPSLSRNTLVWLSPSLCWKQLLLYSLSSLCLVLTLTAAVALRKYQNWGSLLPDAWWHEVSALDSLLTLGQCWGWAGASTQLCRDMSHDNYNSVIHSISLSVSFKIK